MLPCLECLFCFSEASELSSFLCLRVSWRVRAQVTVRGQQIERATHALRNQVRGTVRM